MSNPMSKTAKTLGKALPAQGAKFAALARELECEENDDAFKAALRKVAAAPRQAMQEEPPALTPGKRRPYKKRAT
jgi:hypothetical protein